MSRFINTQHYVHIKPIELRTLHHLRLVVRKISEFHQPF